MSSARNLGLEQAEGEYILFVDSDDYVSADYFASLSSALKNDTADLLMFGYSNFGGVPTEWDTGEFYEDSEIGIAERVSSTVQQYLFSSLWSKVFKKQIIEQYNMRFGSDLAIGEDQAFIFTYAMHIRSIGVLTTDSIAAIGGTVVDEQQLIIRKLLSYKAIQATPQRPFGIINRNNNRIPHQLTPNP